MLLGSTDLHQSHQTEDNFISQLIGENRFAEAYTLLKRESPNQAATQLNLALCFYWAESFKEAIACLDKTLPLLPPGTGNSSLNTDQHDKQLRDRQNQTDDHHLPVTQKYVSTFPALVRDAIIRLKTDCWLRLEDFAKVMETAQPIAHKNYRSINEALQLAKNKLNV